MKIESVAIFSPWDIDVDSRGLSGMSVMVLNAFDRIEFEWSKDRSIILPKSLFAKADWFDRMLDMIEEARQ